MPGATHIQVAAKHLSLALGGMLHARLDGACKHEHRPKSKLISASSNQNASRRLLSMAQCRELLQMRQEAIQTSLRAPVVG